MTFTRLHPLLSSASRRFRAMKLVRKWLRERGALRSLSAEHHSVAACIMTDAEQFTQLTESMKPAEVVELVRKYFSALFAPVTAHGGHVIDEKGDGILAVWTGVSSASELRGRVCNAGVEMVEAAHRFNLAHPHHRLPTRLGIDIGHIAIADLGETACLLRRAVGAPVITANRLEQLNKQLGTRILVSATVAERGGDCVFRDVGSFRLRGKRSDMRVLELMGKRGTVGPDKLELRDSFAHALSLFEVNDRPAARLAFRKIVERFPEDGVTRHYLNLCSADEPIAESAGVLTVGAAYI
jgi:adenylate cyclase